MTRTRRPCLNCNGLAEPGKSRCTSCESQHQQHRNATRLHYRGIWPTISKAAREHHLATVGPICPGWHRPPHQVPATHLTTDHVHPRSLTLGVRVMCKSCNSARRNSDNEEQHTVVATIEVGGEQIAIVR